MDAHQAVDDAIKQAGQLLNAGNYKAALKVVEPLWQRKDLSPEQSCMVAGLLCTCHRSLLDFKAALVFAQHHVDLSIQVYGSRSSDHAVALFGLGQVQLGLCAFTEAKAAYNEERREKEELGKQNSDHYGAVLSGRGQVERHQGSHKEALELYLQAKTVLANHKDEGNY